MKNREPFLRALRRCLSYRTRASGIRLLVLSLLLTYTVGGAAQTATINFSTDILASDFTTNTDTVFGVAPVNMSFSGSIVVDTTGGPTDFALAGDPADTFTFGHDVFGYNIVSASVIFGSKTFDSADILALNFTSGIADSKLFTDTLLVNGSNPGLISFRMQDADGFLILGGRACGATCTIVQGVQVRDFNGLGLDAITNDFVQSTTYILSVGTSGEAILTPVEAVLTPIEMPGIDVVSTSTSLREPTSTTLPVIQRSGVDRNVVIAGNEVQARLRQIGGRRWLTGRGRPSARVGLSAGESDDSQWSAWTNASGSRMRDLGASTAFKSRLKSLLIGVDRLINNNLLLGAMAGHEDHNVDTLFNSGQQDIELFQGALYAGYLIGERFSIDATLGAASISIDQSRFQPFAGQVRSSVDGWRGFAAVNVNAFGVFSDLSVDVSSGILMARDRLNGFRESNGLLNPNSSVKIGQWRAGVNLSYPIGAVEWFGSAFYAYDFDRTEVQVGPNQAPASDDRSEFQLATGLRYVYGDRLSASLEYATVRGRQSLRSEAITVNARLDF